MQKRPMQAIALLLCGVLFLSACGGRQSDNTAKAKSELPMYRWGEITGETITVWGDANDLARPYMVRAFERYQEATGNTVATRSLNKQEQDVLVPDAFTPGNSTLEKPDILLSYGGTNVENLYPEANFYDFTNAPWIDDLTDTALNQAVFNGKVVGLPHGEASVSGMLYNKTIFKKLGLTVPTTQEEFLKVCQVLLENGVTPVYLPYDEITMLLYQFPMDSILEDRQILDELNDGSRSYADIPEMKLIVEWYKTMSDRGYFGKDYQQNSWDGMGPAMESGKYAMMICWDTWLYTDYKGDPKEMGLMPAFIGTPENGCFEGANIVLNLVNKNSPRLEASLDLINFMADPCNYNTHYAGIYTAPVYNRQSGSITTPQYMEAERLIDELFYDSTAWSRVRGFSQIDASYIQEYMQGECTVEECLRRMNDSRLQRAGIKPPH